MFTMDQAGYPKGLYSWMNPGVGANNWPTQQLGSVKKPKLDALGMMPGLWDTLNQLGYIGCGTCKG